MDSIQYYSFILVSMAIIIVPGPNVLIIVSTSISHGYKRGLQTVLGTSSAMILQLSVAAFATTFFVQSISKGFELLRWAGVAYLLYLGIKHLLAVIRHHQPAPTQSAIGSFSRGFFVSLSNPKTILFFSAFLPQFASNQNNYAQQIILLSLSFLFLATFFDGLYAIVAGRLQKLLASSQSQRMQNSLSGIFFLGAGFWLALFRRN
ncbi:MAG: LysE family translocator [Gammaproteobacteria bacterium]|nr:LysE family translocator [Gammaproteobacteria bacterium]MDH5728518.1 LysE family translocator [Gammaproteobacteria bacterium]